MKQSSRSSSLWIAWLVVGIAVVWLGTQFGIWYTPMIVGFLVGAMSRRKGLSWLLAVLTGLAGWGLSLLWQAAHAPIAAAAATVAGIMGLSQADEWLVIVLTEIVAILLATAGWWIGLAGRGLMVTKRRTVD